MQTDKFLKIESCKISSEENFVSINNRGKEEVELGYNKTGDFIEIDFTEGNTA